MPARSAIITVMDRAARKAGRSLARDFSEVEHLQVSMKGPADFVSKADQRAERILYDELLAVRPGWGFMLEEAGIIEGKEGMPRWVVDPLDGTSNFLHGIPHFAISIAVQEPKPGGGWGEIGAAMVYQPLTDDLFWAERDCGAFLHDRRLQVSARRNLHESLIATGIPFESHGDLDQFNAIFNAVAPQVASIRHFGAASLDFAWLAAGRYDGFWEAELQPWGVAAGILIVREARGFVTDFRGGNQLFERSEFLAANDALHSKLHKIVAGVIKSNRKS